MEQPAAPLRVLMGSISQKKIENRLLSSMLPVHAWFTSRKRVKEQANELLEIDLSSCDAELMLRYANIPFVRRYVFNELIDKQLTLLEVGKPPSLPDPGLLAVLEDGVKRIAGHVQKELQHLSSSCSRSPSSESPSHSPVAPHDLLFLMREAETQHTQSIVPQAEMQARSYLPSTKVKRSLDSLSKVFFGDAVAELDRKEVKLIHRHIPPDTIRVGSVEKMRPADITSLFRFYGERLQKATKTKSSFFCQCLVGHLYGKFACHPVYLQQASMYWAAESGLVQSSSAMPSNLAHAVCEQQQMFPALKLKSQFLYASPDIARQLWRTEHFIPLQRLYPLMGSRMVENLAAQLVTEGIWRGGQLQDKGTPLEDHFLQHLREQVVLCSDAFENHPDVIEKRIQEGFASLFPPPSAHPEGGQEAQLG